MRDTRTYRIVISAGILYALVGIVFAWPATHARGWRLAAWVVSAAGFAAHLAYERFIARGRPTRSAWRASLGVALGAFGLAVAANLHSLAVAEQTGQHRGLLRAALVIWPVMTGAAAFLVAFVASGVVGRLARDSSDHV